jgi:hypothetical protein
MTDQRDLDRLLDAFFIEGTDEVADRVIDAALDEIDHTQQRRALRMPRRFSTMTMPTRIAAAAVIGVLAVGATLYVIRPDRPAVGGPSPTRGSSTSPDVAVVVSPSPNRIPSLATPSHSSQPCFTDTLQVLTGGALRARVGGDYVGDPMAGLGSGRGVYIGAVGPLQSGLWAVGPGDGPPRPIAAITPRPLILDVLDLSPDGSIALLRVGNVILNSPEPECADLYALRTDGSGATRLTTPHAGRRVAGAAFSPDGRQVAYSVADQFWPGPATITVLDLASGHTVDQPCNNGYPGTVPIDWSPASDRLAVACYQALRIFDPTGTTAPVDVPTAGLILAFLWTNDGHILAVTEHGDVTSFDVAAGTSTVVGHLDFSGIELVVPSPASFSPDGRWFTFLGGERGDVPGDNFRIVGYLVPASGGRPTRILNENEASSTVTWSADSRALVSAHESGKQVDDMPVLTLGRLDLDTLQWFSLGRLPGAQGVWQIP